MIKLSTVLATSVATLSLLGVAALPANASPTPEPTPVPTQVAPPQQKTIDPGNPPAKTGTYSLNSGQKEYVDLAHKATDPAHTNSKGQIDWNWVEDVFSGHSISKNGFGAGWWARKGDWSQFTHLSSNDKKGIVAWSKTHEGPNPKMISTMVERRAPKPCKGESLVYEVNNGTIWDYLNSCDTDLLIAKAGVCSAAVATLGTISAVITRGKTAVPVSVAGLACIGGLGWLSYAQKRSDLDAVIIRVDTQLIHRGSHYESPYWIYPQ